MNWIWWSIIGANFAAVILFVALSFAKNRQLSVCLAVTFILLPVVGMLMYAIVELFLLLSRKSAIFDTGDLMTFKERVTSEYRSNLQEALNIVSVKEALLASDTGEKRSLIRSLLKKDIGMYSKSVRDALDDDDTETTHYAASAVMEIYRKMTLHMQKLESLCLLEPLNMDNKLAFLDAAKEYADSGILSHRDEKLNRSKYIGAAKEIDIAQPELLRTEHYATLVDFLLQANEKADALTWALRAKDLFKDEESYLNALRACYERGEQKMFAAILEELKQSEIALSEKAVDRLRYWMVR